MKMVDHIIVIHFKLKITDTIPFTVPVNHARLQGIVNAFS